MGFKLEYNFYKIVILKESKLLFLKLLRFFQNDKLYVFI